MKSILLSIKPKWCVKIMNGEKTIEVRKNKSLATAIQKLINENGYADIYVYCSKDKKNKLEYCDINDGCWCANDGSDYYNGKVVARFWCDKVEEIVCQNAFNEPTYNTELLSERDLCIKSCLGLFGLFDYLGNKNGFAIHISKLEIFDRPKELSEFKHYNKPNCDSCQFQYNAWCDYHKEVGCDNIPLTKAPQNYCYIEGEQR